MLFFHLQYVNGETTLNMSHYYCYSKQYNTKLVQTWEDSYNLYTSPEVNKNCCGEICGSHRS